MACVEDREAFLRQPNVAVLATASPDGRPHAAPVWYLYEDGVFYMSTGRGSRKHRNLEANPQAVLVVDKRSIPYFAVMVFGRVELRPRLPDELRLKMAVHYLGEEAGRGYIEQNPDPDAVTLALHPERVVEYHGRIRRQGE